jgi:hypothetical protein
MAQGPTNQAVKTADSIIHSAIYDVAVSAAESAVIAEVPFLGLPVVKQIFGAALNYFAGIVYTYLAQAATIQIITLQTDAEKNAYAKAELELRTAHLTGNQDAINKATDDFKKALTNIVHFDGATSA